MLQSLYKPFVIASLFLAACANKNTEEAPVEEKVHDPNLVELTPEQYKNANIQLGSVQYINLTDYIKASGTIDAPPQQTISITSPYGGIIKSTSVLEGKYIGKGQVVATLENPEFVQMQQDYLESSSQLSFLGQDLKRQEELVRENIAAAKSLQRARSEYNTMVARVEGLKSRLRLIGINPGNVRSGSFTSRVNIYAPAGGYVTKVYSNVGKYAGANEALADLVNTNSIFVNVKVFERDIPSIRIGQRLRFRTTGDTVERNADIFLIGKDIDADRAVQVFAKIVTPGQHLLPGMFVNAIIEKGAVSSPALPEEAIVQAGGKNFIFISIPDTATTKSATGDKEQENHIAFKRVEVQTTVTENGYTGIILPEDFDRKNKIVVKGAYALLSKMNNSEEEEGH